MSGRIEMSQSELDQLVGGKWAIPVDDTVYQIEGPGALACLQGILSNDVVKPGTPSLVWGAVLTPKGMIVADLWIRRIGDTITAIVPAAGREAFATLMQRSIPPRLARVSVASPPMSVWWLVGGSPSVVNGVDVATPTESAPFSALAIGPTVTSSALLAAAGWAPGPSQRADVLRLMAGWPVLGREIDDRTLPQEVRFDELHGVKYDKGCFTGQETVARLHFRGHANRTLRAISGVGPPPTTDSIVAGSKEVGRIATLATIDGQWVATAKIRREVPSGAEVHVEEHVAQVRDLPLTAESLRA